MDNPKKKAAKKDKPKNLAEAGLESFKMVTVHRSVFQNADYNPRVITDQERDKLKAALKRHGLVAPITYNKQTGNIVGGHQRISIMDSLMRTQDYELNVAEIDVPLNREKELNVVLNNTRAMGSWDFEGLKAIFEDESVELVGAGFDKSDMISMFGDSAFDERQADLKELADKLSSISESYDSIQRANKKKTEGEFFLVLVFPTSDQIDALLAHYKLPENRYQDGTKWAELMGFDLPDAD